MFVKLLDLHTGEVRESQIFQDASVFFWAEGNGSCDCNRILSFQKSTKLNTGNKSMFQRIAAWVIKDS